MRGSVRGDGRKPVPYRDVLAVVKQGLGCDFDRLHDLANQHMAIRQFLGHADIGDKTRYHYQTLVDNVSLLTPKLLGKVNQLAVESGHTVVGKSLASPCAGAVTRLSLKPMFIIPQTLICCGMRCAVCSAMQGAPPQNMMCRVFASGCICKNLCNYSTLYAACSYSLSMSTAFPSSAI